MHLVPFTLTFAVASLIPVAAPQQPLQASLGVGYSKDKIDFKIAAVQAAVGEKAGPVILAKPLEPAFDGAVQDATASDSGSKPAGQIQDGTAYDATMSDANGKEPDTTSDATSRAVPVPVPSAYKLAGSPAVLVVSPSAKLTVYLDILPPLLSEGIILDIGALDATGSLVVSRYAKDFPAGMAWFAQAAMLVDGQVLASNVHKFAGTGEWQL